MNRVFLIGIKIEKIRRLFTNPYQMVVQPLSFRIWDNWKIDGQAY